MPLEDMREGIQASQELLGAYESFKSKVNKLYSAKLISSGMYSELMISLRDIYCIITARAMAQERQYERAGGTFFERKNGFGRGMFTSSRS